jgi:hypothetical protein
MEQTKEFTFSTPLMADYGEKKGKLVAYAHISAKVSYNEARYGAKFDADYATFHYVRVELEINRKTQDCTFAYLVSKDMLGDFSETIDKAINAHAEYVFGLEDERTGLGEHSDDSPEMRNPSLHNGY